jgi:hypothetical protein
MGLDIYAGPLARYYTGSWETIMQRTAREQGMKLRVVYAGESPARLSEHLAPHTVSRWRDHLRSKYRIPNGLIWSEETSTPYWTDKPDHDGQRALVLAAAHAEHPKFELPTALPDDMEKDPAYFAAGRDYVNSIIAVLECHLFLPSEQNFIFSEDDPVGIRRVTTSTANLSWALDVVNTFYWRASEAQIAEWGKRGPFVESEDGKIMHNDGVPSSTEPFQHAAQFGFALYNEALAFSRKHNVPILTDE